MALIKAFLVRPGKYVTSSLNLNVNLKGMYSYDLPCCLREQSNLISPSVHFAGALVAVFGLDFLVGEFVSESDDSLLMVMMCGYECQNRQKR